MSRFIDEPIAKVLADMAVFLEFSTDKVLDEDAAVGAMEQFAAELQKLPHDSQALLATQLQGLAPQYQDPAQQKFVSTLGETFGLT